MYQVNLISIYMLGAGIHSLGEIPEGTKAADLIRNFTPTNWLLRHFIEGSPVPLMRTVPFAKILRDGLREIEASLQADPGRVLSADERLKLFYAVGAFEKKLAHETDHFDVFYIPPRGTHNTIRLIEDADENLSEDVRHRLTQDTIDNLQQAGRCLALNAPTASAFHMFRATETLIRAYHLELTSKTLPIKARNWGAYIRDLNNNGADPQVTGYLQHIKDYYRNPIMHPDATLTPDDALSLFGASLSAITQLDAAIEICKRKKGRYATED